MEWYTWLLLIASMVVLFFAVWSFASNPSQFMDALMARGSFLVINFTAIAKSIVTTVLSGLYVIFDPIPIIIDDVAIIIFAIYTVKRLLKRIVKEMFPFPKPWRSY